MMNLDDRDGDITVIKCGVRFKPPALIVYYERSSDVAAGSGRRARERVMPLRNFTSTSNVQEFVSSLSERHHKVLGGGRVSRAQLERLARVIQLNMEGLKLEESLDRASREYEVDPDEDLNKVDGEVLRRKKQVMDETFQVNRKKPGDPDFQYDVQVSFDNAAAGQGIETSGWDSDNSDDIF